MLTTLRKAPRYRNKFASNWSGIQSAIDTHNRATSRRLLDTLSACKWLAEGAPIADVLTMLEVRRRFDFPPHYARAYAVEILSAVRAEIHTINKSQIAHRKEPANAVA